MNISSPDWVDDTTVKYEQRVGDTIKIWYGETSPAAPGSNWMSALSFVNDLPPKIWHNELGAIFGTEHNIKWETEPREVYRVVPAAATEQVLRKALLDIETLCERRQIDFDYSLSDGEYLQKIRGILDTVLEHSHD